MRKTRITNSAASILKIGKNQTIISLPKTNRKSWSAAFVTASFQGLQVSTPIFIYLETYPKENQIMPQQGACRLIMTIKKWRTI